MKSSFSAFNSAANFEIGKNSIRNVWTEFITRYDWCFAVVPAWTDVAGLFKQSSSDMYSTMANIGCTVKFNQRVVLHYLDANSTTAPTYQYVFYVSGKCKLL